MQQPPIKAEWERFLACVMPKEASREQVQDTQAAFYAGASAMFTMLAEITEGTDEKQACEWMSALDRELKKHVIEVMARAMTQEIAKATGAEVRVEVRDMPEPATGEEAH